MDAQGNGLSLEGLAKILETQTQRLETLERENERMHSVNAELQHKVATLEGSGTRRNEVSEMRGSEVSLNGQPVSVLEGQVSRRSLLSKAGAAAVAAVAAGTLIYPREARANHYSSGIEVDYVRAHSDQIAVHGISDTSHAVYGRSENPGPDYAGVAGRNSTEDGTGVSGVATNGVGVRAIGNNGVHGQSITRGWAGVYGNNTTDYGFGVVGDGKGSGAGVLGRNQTGDGVQGETRRDGYSGVYGYHNGTSGYGVTGVGRGSGMGVVGKNFDAGGIGVLGEATNGYGGWFQGGKAHLFLKPAGSAGRPAGAHSKGEIYLDKNANLFVCTQDGTPGTWRRIQTVAT